MGPRVREGHGTTAGAAAPPGAAAGEYTAVRPGAGGAGEAGG